jgi:hypothetical protein
MAQAIGFLRFALHAPAMFEDWAPAGSMSDVSCNR